MKRRIRRTWRRKTAALAAAFMAMSFGGITHAMPQDGTIRSGEGNITRPDDKTMTIDQKTDRLAIDWKGFDVQNGERVNFNQPDARAIALNRVTGDAKSVIDGQLTANGRVYVINPNGVLFGRNASVDVGSLVASTANVSDDTMKNFAGSKDTLTLTLGDNSTAPVINEGTIKAQGGLVALHAASVENDGTIANEGGKVALAAAKNITLSEDTAGKINFTVDGALAKASTLNSGVLRADGGYVVMTAKQAGDVMSTVVNNTGTIEAKTLRQNEKGEILLDGGNNGVVEVSGTIDASGLENNQSAGSIKVIGNTTTVHDGTNLLARGTIDGGKIETSGDVLNLGSNLNIDAKGINGNRGEWLLDPLDVIIADEDPTGNYDTTVDKTKKYEADGSLSSNTSIAYHDPAAKDSADAAATSSAVTWIKTKTITDLLNQGTDVTIQAAATNGVANITVNSAVSKTAGTDATFTLDAMRNITINKSITSSSGKLNILLNSDTDGNQVGAVIINADINTNGGYFTSASGGNLAYNSSSTTKGYDVGSFTAGTAADPKGSTVGTYFGNINDKFVADGSKANRSIKTEGGAITLNGEVAVGLAGGTLTLDSTNGTDVSGNPVGGDVKVTGIINSGNSYATYIYGTDAWKKLIQDSGLVEQYLEAGTVPSYHYKAVNYVTNSDGTYKVDANGNYETTTEAREINGPHYTYSEANTEDPRWTGQGVGYSTTKGTGWTSVEVTGTDIKDSMTVQEFLMYYKTAAVANFNAKYSSLDLTQDNATLVATIKAHPTLLANLTADINDLLSVNWFVAKQLAQGTAKGGSAVNDTYLAMLTTVLENSLTAPDGPRAVFVGARGSGVLHKLGTAPGSNVTEEQKLPYSYYGLPDDPLFSNGMYWVTGPEGEANNGKGTQFYSNLGSDWATIAQDADTKKYVYNSGSNTYGYVNWATWPVKVAGHSVTRTQPDNSGPFLTVGYGTNGQWDDISMAGGYGGATSAWAKGFIQEKNLAHSNLNIQAGSGTVNLQGNIGGSEKIDTVTIHTTGNVTTGGSRATDYNMGTINTDHGIDITGADVTIGGRMTSGSTTNSGNTNATDNITINATGDITVHGITSNGKTDANGGLLNGGKISLTSTKSNGIITLTTTTDKEKKDDALGDDGTLTAASGANDAVVIDAQGTSGSFVNATSKDAKNAITTGAGGSWKIYSASPDLDTFGTNLNSSTDAMWTSKSNQNTITDVNEAGVTLSSYDTNKAADENASGKFIFQVQPTITVSAGEHEKTYGTLLTSDDLHAYLTDASYAIATFKDANGNDHKVTDYTAFREKSPSNYIDSTTITLSSDAAPAEATRLNGDKKDSNGAVMAVTEPGINGETRTVHPVYNLAVNIDKAVKKNGYGLQKKDGQITINAKTVTLSGSGEQTYGNSTINNWTDNAKDNTSNGLLDGATITYTLNSNKPEIKSGSSYETSLKKHPNGSTADASDTVYQDALDNSNFSNIKISDAAGNDMSANYTVTITGDLKVNKADITLNLNAVKTTYGKAFDTNEYGYDHHNIPVLNGDNASVITDNLQDKDLKYTNTGDGTDGRATQDAGSDYKLKADDTSLGNYNIHFNDGDSVIEKAKLSITTPDITTEYGTVTPGSGSSLTGLTNGDENDTTGLVYDYTYGNGYLDHDTRTNNLGDYTVTTDVSGKDYLKNYEITPGKSNLHIDPKDVYVRVDGKGNTTQDITYVDPDIDGKLSYGDHATWTPNLGGQTGEFTYDVITDINGHPFKPGESDVIGNYRFHYDGEAVVSPSKPDIEPPVVPPVVPGNGGYTLPTNPQTPSEKESGTVEKDWGTRDEGPGIDRERHIIKVQLPFFKIDDGKMTNYGTYDVKSQAAKVDISPTGKRLPEPNQPKTQYREYTKDITTSTGTGEFRLIYNGSTFHVMPLNAAARTMMQTGDEKHNVDLFAQALHIGFSEMGIIPADLDGVYANFQDIAADAQNNSK
ncbi:filamentous hemagglutinin N-terminal domain-containing protein [uncultured Mitsuokella sp.]|uniref:two-partner secretion domain-containing protein n=1 Tax=uncultured Mitsuokella sp. TaxID=453120 RepID=UPI00261E81E9|nr:filamentous hemagglutinin N-terminal domain-containing protein [uncultured Mitsuokella sp.]